MAGRGAGCGRDGACGTGSTGAIRVVTICSDYVNLFRTQNKKPRQKIWPRPSAIRSSRLIFITTMHVRTPLPLGPPTSLISRILA